MRMKVDTAPSHPHIAQTFGGLLYQKHKTINENNFCGTYTLDYRGKKEIKKTNKKRRKTNKLLAYTHALKLHLLIGLFF